VGNLTSAQAPGWAVFWVAFFTTATYVNAGWLREQVCIYMCPYARFQSAMIDRDTLVVSYDPGRGEPRGSRKKAARTTELGDCIDCTLCVQVCPVGIDIRDGLQYQCIGCAHCIDACNQVMAKMDYATGLIRYTTEHALMGGTSHWWRARSIAYATVLLAMTAALATAVVLRVPFQVDVVRERGDLFQTTTTGLVTNAYSLLILNKSQEPKELVLKIEADLPLESTLTQTIFIQPGERLDLPLTLSTAREAVALPHTSVTVHICEVPDGPCVSEETSFLGPFR
jgi:cytochrome c oxidase accessory protein FixG